MFLALALAGVMMTPGCGGGGDDEEAPPPATLNGGVAVPGGTTYFGDGQNPDGNLGVYNDCAEQKPPTCGT
jgi:hypothetical protein